MRVIDTAEMYAIGRTKTLVGEAIGAHKTISVVLLFHPR
jgi:aryl-alcohol dehydrogenase-like predicted oxidoreductase